MATEQNSKTLRTTQPRPSLFNKQSILLISAFVTAGILLFFIPELSRNYLLSVVTITLLLALCWTALPIAELLFDEKSAQRIFVFPIGFIFHAVLLSFAGYIFGINLITFAVYSAFSAASFILSRRLKRSTEAKTSDFQDTVWLFVWLAIVAAALFFSICWSWP